MQLKSGVKTQEYLSHLYCTHRARQYEMREGVWKTAWGDIKEKQSMVSEAKIIREGEDMRVLARI